MAQTWNIICGGDKRTQGRIGIMWPRRNPNMSSTTQEPMCLMRSKSRPGMILDRDQSPLWSLDTLARTVSTRCQLLKGSIYITSWTKSTTCFLFNWLWISSANQFILTRTPLKKSVMKHLLLSHTYFLCSEPTNSPTDLQVSKVDSTKATIRWKPVDMASVQGQFKEYRVRLFFFNENQLQKQYISTFSSASF